MAALRATPRDLFVTLALQPFAYVDRPLPIGNGATISHPFIVAWMTNLLQPAKTNRVLETGSGYQAAVLSRLSELQDRAAALGCHLEANPAAFDPCDLTALLNCTSAACNCLDAALTVLPPVDGPAVTEGDADAP